MRKKALICLILSGKKFQYKLKMMHCWWIKIIKLIWNQLTFLTLCVLTGQPRISEHWLDLSLSVCSDRTLPQTSSPKPQLPLPAETLWILTAQVTFHPSWSPEHITSPNNYSLYQKWQVTTKFSCPFPNQSLPGL